MSYCGTIASIYIGIKAFGRLQMNFISLIIAALFSGNETPSEM